MFFKVFKKILLDCTSDSEKRAFEINIKCEKLFSLLYVTRNENKKQKKTHFVK